jgi:hypothetical protein
MNKGQVLFGVVAIACFIILSNYDRITWNNYDTVSPLGIVITFIFFPLAFIGFFVILLNLVSGTGVSFSYRAPSDSPQPVHIRKDPNHISRVVGDTNTKEEYIIFGAPDWSYRTALLSDWPFNNVSKSGDWIVKDERGNDISNTPLERYDSIASIEYHIPEKSSIEEYREKSDDRSDEYTSIDQGVTYYD